MQVREKVEKSRNTMFFQWFVAPEGRKVGSLKRRVRSRLGRWEMNNCTPLWRETHLEVKMCKAHQVRTTFGSWDVEQVHAVVARSTFPSQNVESTSCSDHFWGFRCGLRGRRKGFCTLPKVSKTRGFCSISKDSGRRGTSEEDPQRCMWRGRRSTMTYGVDKSQNLLVRGRQLCTHLSIFEGSLRELLRFWCCQLRYLRKSRRLVSFLTLSSSKMEGALKNCFVFDVVNFEHWWGLAELSELLCFQDR